MTFFLTCLHYIGGIVAASSSTDTASYTAVVSEPIPLKLSEHNPRSFLGFCMAKPDTRTVSDVCEIRLAFCVFVPPTTRSELLVAT